MVKEPAVVDSACLIGLERIGRLDLLPALIEPVLAPTAVETEFGSRPSWLAVARPVDQGMIAALRLLVDPGESEAITLAYEGKTRIILDDRKAREVAQRLGLRITGTVGLLLLAKQRGVITLMKPLMDALDAHSFRIASALKLKPCVLQENKGTPDPCIRAQDDHADWRFLSSSFLFCIPPQDLG